MIHFLIFAVVRNGRFFCERIIAGRLDLVCFQLEMSEPEAAAFMEKVVAGAYNAKTSGFYDWIQYKQQKIPK